MTVLKVDKPGKKNPRQGEVWLIRFDQVKETRKPFRPCLIISHDNQNQNDEEIIVSPLTTQEVIAGEVQFFEVLVENNQEVDLGEPNRILLNRIHTIDKELRLIKKLGKVDNKTWNQAWTALWVVFTGKKIS